LAAAQAKTTNAPRQLALSPNPQPSEPLPFQAQLVVDEPGENTESITNHANNIDTETLQVEKTPLMDYTAIQSATVTRNASSGAPEINVEFSPEGGELFAAITKENINKRLAIVLDGQVYVAPVIRSEIMEGKAQITGNFLEEQANELAAKINELIVSR
jgi:preprotein translocase subunit SecD